MHNTLKSDLAVNLYSAMSVLPEGKHYQGPFDRKSYGRGTSMCALVCWLGQVPVGKIKQSGQKGIPACFDDLSKVRMHKTPHMQPCCLWTPAASFDRPCGR